MSKRFLYFLVLIVLVFSIGCTPQAAPPAAPTEEKPSEPTKAPEVPAEPTKVPEEPVEAEKSDIQLAILLSGTVDDLSWNYQMQQAAMKLAEEKGMTLDISEKVPAAEAERVIREYADNGYNFIIAHSFSYGEAMFKVAEDYPEVNFAWPGGVNKTAENIADYDQPFYQAAYLMGIMANGVSSSNVYSFLSGFDIPVCHSMMEAFKLGVESVNSDAKVLYTFTGDWVDVAKSKEAVLAHVDAGADYVASCGFGPTQGAIAAAKEKGIYASSYVGNMTSLAPDTVLLNMVWDLYPLLSVMVSDIETDSFSPGKYYQMGVADDVLKVEINPDLKDKIPAESLDQAESVRKQIVDGAFEVPFVPKAEE